jgi:hypothetical protein
MLLPQRWDGHNLIANLLLLPNGDPTQPVPLISGHEDPFAIAQPKLRAVLLPGLGVPSWDPAIPPGSLIHTPLTLTYSSTESAIYAGLASQFTPVVPVLSQAAGGIRKDLPRSYREATGFATPNSQFFTAGDGFGCALGAAQPNTTQVAARAIAWGEIISYALRQPLLAQAMGLMYLQVSIPIDPTKVTGGGWIWLEIDTSSPSNWYAKLVTEQPNAVTAYSARLPQLTTTAQDVFAAVLFPTVPGAYDSSVLDAAQFEADLYSDGFAKIVHVDQPTSADVAVGSDQTLVPGTDAGIQIGWDDEQVTTWVNRQVQIAQALAAGTNTQELPFSVLGYRVDVRDSAANPWASLCAASGKLNAAGVFTTSFNAQDLAVEPTPLQNGGAGQDYWLPRYFAQWRGRTLVVNDKYAYAFSGGQPPAPPTGPPDTKFVGTLNESLSGVGLRFGQTYDFRTRLADLTGGGPKAADANPDDAGVATIMFKRYVPPKKVVATLGTFNAATNSQPLTVDRPSINYPEMVFAGAADQKTLDKLLAITPPTPPVRTFPPPDGKPLPPYPKFQAALLDPDVVTLEIIVEAQAPAHDTGNAALMADAATPPNAGDLDGIFRVVYRYQLPFPALATPVAIGASTPLKLTLQGTAMPHIDNPTLPSAAHPTVLPIPNGRNIRIRLRGLSKADPTGAYFGSGVARTGITSDIRVRFENATEPGLIQNTNPAQQLQAFYLRDLDNTSQQSVVSNAVISAIRQGGGPWTEQSFRNLATTLVPGQSTPLQLLASALNLRVDGQTLSAPPGKRILFGAQSSLRHTLPQDRSSITFATQKDLIGHWIVVQRLVINRDWTWSGLAQNGTGQIAFTFRGAVAPITAPVPPPLTDLGQIGMPGVVSRLATQDIGDPAQRDTSELIFFSTMDSTVAVDAFPSPLQGSFQLVATFTGNPTGVVPLLSSKIEVPITAPPRQIPQLVSAGIAESPFSAAPDYSSTNVRQRALWLEFDWPPTDPNDSYFVRVLGYGPDPLLMSFSHNIQAAAEPPLPIDPEPIRQITVGATNDDAGLSAMTQLKHSESSSVHFLVPLPDSVSPEQLDLFGFWTYEIRAGHLEWSTAQGRFGRPFRVSGVQHPCPHLIANVERIVTIPTNGGGLQPCVVASAELAQTVLNGVSLTSSLSPQTQIWFLLYAQLRRTDGQAYRNLLLARLRGTPPIAGVGTVPVGPPIPRPSPPTGVTANPSMGGMMPRQLEAHAIGTLQTQAIVVQAAFAQSDINAVLAAFNLPTNTPISVLAVEVFNREGLVIQVGPVTGLNTKPQAGSSVQSASSSAVAVAEAVATQPDPLGQDLGIQRIMRVSPLTAVRNVC